MTWLEERFTSHEGRTIRYVIGGSGPPMLLCHGFIGAAENFNDWFAELLPRRTVVVPDLPGFGKSPPLAGRHSGSTLAGAALAVAADAGIERFDVAGLCLGSCVALAVQRLRPDAVDRVLLHTPLLAPHLVRRRYHVQVAIMLAPVVFSGIVWLAHQRVVSDLYKRVMVEGSDVDPEAARVNFENQLRADPAAARQWLRDGLRRDDLAQVRSCDRPVMIIVARHDRIVHVTRMKQALHDAHNVQLAVIEDAGHGWTEAMGLRQRACIAAFLDGRPLPAQQAAVEAA